MSYRQAEELSSVMYKVDRNISLGARFYISDIDCESRGSMLRFSAVRTKFNRKEVVSKEPKICMSTGNYIAFLEKERKKDLFQEYIYVFEKSIFKIFPEVVRERSREPMPVPDFNGQVNLRPRMHSFVKENTQKIWPTNAGDTAPELRYTPQGIAISKTGEILICLWNNEIGEKSFGKVITSNEHFEIFTDKNRPLYVCPTYIAENRNGDICVSDVRALVVTDAGGMLRFRYQGHPSSSNFDPYGICCDSSCNIIVADMKKDNIHLIDKDGTFLYLITYDGIRMPRALCMDKNDTLYVGEWHTDTIKVIPRSIAVPVNKMGRLMSTGLQKKDERPS